MQYLQEAFLTEHGVFYWMGRERVVLLVQGYDAPDLQKRAQLIREEGFTSHQ